MSWEPNAESLDFEASPDQVFSIDHIVAGGPAAPGAAEVAAALAGAGVPAEAAALAPGAQAAGGEAAAGTTAWWWYRRVSGRYRGTQYSFELELRVDADGVKPLKMVSGDYFSVSGATKTYFGSFSASVSVSVDSTTVTLVGVATTTWPSTYNTITVTIPRRTVFQPPGDTTVKWSTSAGQPGASYVCNYESPYFRTLVLEQDQETGANPFTSYNTGALPSGGTARTLSVAGAYAEAGIQMSASSKSNVVGAPPGGKWTNAELHTAMENHFSYWKDIPQWVVWLFHAKLHEMGSGLYGIMFDQKGKQRQGCAVFYAGIGNLDTDSSKRDGLYTTVHELGHCFNLYHSFHKSYMTPPLPNRPLAMSWMNYPWYYPGGGASGFWAAFPFQFDNLELVHLRHGSYNNVIFGANPFGTGAALDVSGEYTDAVVDNSGLKLEVKVPRSFAYGEPVVVETKLSITDLRGKLVHERIHPDFGFVQLAIQKPGGEAIPYRPPLTHCIEENLVQLDESKPAIYASAYIGFDGEKGQVFDAPGVYRLKAAYFAPDGSVVLSEVATVTVRSPLSAEDAAVAELMLGDEQGMLLYLLGSDGASLERGNEALETVLSDHPKHPLALYARMVSGFNLARPFTNVAADGDTKTRKAKPDEAESLLSKVVVDSKGDQGLDNISLNETMRQLAKVQAEGGDKEKAKATMKRMVDMYTRMKLPAHVLATIKEQAKEAV